MAYRSELLDKFQTEYARLNDQQKKAVDQIEGPVMVIAGRARARPRSCRRASAASCSPMRRSNPG
jgi:hypothetical protein